MSSILSTRRLATLLGAGAAVVALAAPAASQAAVPSPVSSVTWNVRTSWVNYVTNPSWYAGLGQGSITRTASNGGTSTVAAGSATTSWASGFTNYAYSYAFAKSADAGSPRTVVLKGGLDFDLSAHSIDISLTDVKVQENAAGDERLIVDATYVPVGGGTASLPDAHAFNVADAADASGHHAVTLTATGAQIFNGGANGSYAAGDAFGTVDFR